MTIRRIIQAVGGLIRACRDVRFCQQLARGRSAVVHIVLMFGDEGRFKGEAVRVPLATEERCSRFLRGLDGEEDAPKMLP